MPDQDALVSVAAMIDVRRAALAREGISDSDRASLQGLLSAALLVRFEQTGALQDLDQSIDLLNESLRLTAHDDAARPTYLADLGNALRLHFEHFGDADRLDEAIRLYNEALAVTPSDSLDRVTRLTNLAGALSARALRTASTTDLEAAEGLLQEALRASPAEGLDTGTILSNLGVTLRLRWELLGDVESLDRAVATFRQALATVEEGDPTRSRRLFNLAACLHARFEQRADPADLSEAAVLLTSAIAGTPPDRPDYGRLLASLGGVLENLGNLEEATTVYREALARIEQALGPDHPESLSVRGNFAMVTGQQGNLNEAEEMFRTTLDMQQRALGVDHPETLTTQHNLATILEYAGRHDEAASVLRNLLERRMQALGPDHQDTVAVSEELVNLLGKHSDDPANPSNGEPEIRADQLVIVTDIAQYSQLAGIDQLHTRDRFFRAINDALVQSGVVWEECSVQDLGDGVIIVPPAKTAPGPMVGAVPARLAGGLEELRLRRSGVPLRVRMAFGIGRLQRSASGWAGEALVSTARAVGSAEVRRVSAEEGRLLTVAVTDPLFQALLTRGQIVANEYYEVRIDSKHDAATAWVQRGRIYPPELPRLLPLGALSRIVDALLAIPEMRSQVARDAVVALLPIAISSAVPYTPIARVHAISIVTACSRFEDGLQTLMEAARAVADDSIATRAFESVVTETLSDSLR